MVQLEKDTDQNVYYCYDCDTEFIAEPTYELEETVSFCPFCGSEITSDEDDDMLDDDFDENDDFNENENYQ